MERSTRSNQQREQSQIHESHTNHTEDNSRIRIENIPRISVLEGRFRAFLEGIQKDFGPINWSRTKIEEQPGRCTLVFFDTSVHAGVVRAYNRKTFEGFTLHWNLEWLNQSAFGSPPIQDVPPPQRAFVSERNVESPTASIRPVPQEDNLRWLTEEKLKAIVNSAVTSRLEHAFSIRETRLSIIVDQAVLRALNRVPPRADRNDEQGALYSIQSFAAQARRASCPICYENLGRMPAENVLQLNACGHYICRECRKQLNARNGSQGAVTRCPVCRTQGLARRGYFLF